MNNQPARVGCPQHQDRLRGVKKRAFSTWRVDRTNGMSSPTPPGQYTPGRWVPERDSSSRTLDQSTTPGVTRTLASRGMFRRLGSRTAAAMDFSRFVESFVRIAGRG